MSRPLRVLLIEDSEPDAQLLLRHLRQGGCAPEWRRVETAAELEAALAAADWEVVISDYRLPNFTGLDALKLVQAHRQDLPFILVSGAIGEEQTAAVMKAGAHDFLLKDRLARLAPAVSHELEAASVRRQRALAEAALGESEARYRALFESMQEGFCTIEMIFDAQGKPVDYRFLEINPAFESQTGLPAARGKLMRSLAPNHEAHWFEIYGRIALTGQPATFENEARELGRYFSVSAWRVGGPDSRKVGILFTDITERQRAKAAMERQNQELEQRVAERTASLQQALKEMEQFAYVASHDLQEPLRAVGSFSQLLARRCRHQLDADADEYISFIVDAAARMQTLINDLLALSRIGTRGAVFAPVAGAEILQTVTANLELAIQESGAVITHDPLPALVADRTQLTQLFQNLLGNAIKFRRPQEAPRIHVSAAREAGAWRLSVRDNGIGIDAKYFDRIFIVFQRLHNRDEYPGTGIGLAICKKIVERHGGRLWVESQPGSGSTFQFTIPDAKQ